MRGDHIEAFTAEALTPFLLERMRAGDDLLDGIFFRARELIERPPVGSSLRAAERAWAADPEPIKSDESYSDWSRMLRPILRPRRRREPATDLADLRPTDVRAAFVSILSLVRPPRDDIVVFGVGAGDPRPADRIAPGSLPRGRLAGVAALISYWTAIRRFRPVLPRDVARAASESLRALSARWLAGLPEGRTLDEETAANLLRAARRAEVDAELAERVFADQRDGRAPALEDVAYLFARPSPAYARVFDRVVGRDARPELHDAYARGGAFDSLRDVEPTPGPRPVAVRVGAVAQPEGDREIDVGLAPTVPLVVAAAIASVPRGAARLRASLIFESRTIAAEDRAASESRYFRWMIEARGGSYRIVADALDADGAIAASGASGELRVRQFAHCVRCPRRVDFGDPAFATASRDCVWTASPRPGTAPAAAESKDLEMTARYGENERTRAAARAAWLAGRTRGRFVVPGEPSAPPIEYLGAHSPDRRGPDFPRIADTGEFARGSLVAARADEMRALEAAAADPDEAREARDRAVATLRRMLEGREAEDPREIAKAREATARRLEAALRDAIARFRSIAAPLEAAVSRGDPVEFPEMKEIKKAHEAYAAPDDDADLEGFVGREAEIVRDVETAYAAMILKLEMIAAGAKDFAFRLDAAKAFVAGRDERSALTRAIGEAEDLAKIDLDEMRKGPAELRGLRERAIGEANGAIARAKARLADLRAEREIATDSERWNRAATAVLATLDAIPLAFDFGDELASALADLPETISTRADADAVATAMGRIEYAETRDRVAALRADLERVADRIPVGADADVAGAIPEALANSKAKLESWTREADERASRIDDWRHVVAGYFDALADFAPAANVERDILDQIARAEDPDARASELDQSWSDVARARRALERKAVSAAVAIEDAGKKIGTWPPPSPGDFERAREAARAARRARIEAEEARARESADEARRRRADEFEAHPKVAEFDEIADRVGDAEAKLRPGKATSIDEIAAMDSDLRKLEDIALPRPEGASDAEAAELARSRKERLAALRLRLLGGVETRNAIAADLVTSRAFETFATRSVKTAEIALATRLAWIDRTAKLMERAGEYLDFERLPKELEDLRARVERRGRENVARMRATELAKALTDSIALANAEIASEPKPPEDLEGAVEALIASASARVDAIELLRDADERLREANGEYAREYGDDAKAKGVEDFTSKASKLLAEFVRVSDAGLEKRRDAALAALRGARDVDLALRLVAKLEAEGIEDASEVDAALRRRLTGSVAQIVELAAAAAESAPSADLLAFDRGAAAESLARIESLRTRPGSDAEAARVALDEAEKSVRAELEPARLAAMRTIASAYTLAKYGGDAADSAVRALEFLARDREIYGDVFGTVSLAGAYTFTAELLDPGAMERILAGFRNAALTEGRCRIDARVRPGALTCALDSIVMLAAKADPQIMGRILGARPSECARGFSIAMRRIDAELERGQVPESGCDDLRAQLLKCEPRDERLRQILFEAGDRARPKETLDAADVLGWLNAVYAIEPVRLISEEVIMPESTRDTMSGILREAGATRESIAATFAGMDSTTDPEKKADILGAALLAAGLLPTPVIELVARFRRNPIAPPPLVSRSEHAWPYSFAIDLFEGSDALHEVAVEDPVEAPRSFAIHPIDREGAFAEMIRTGAKKIHPRFARWGYSYRLVAIVHWRPGHYWITLRCGEEWYRYDSTRREIFRRLPRDDPLDAETLGSAQMIFYARGLRTATTPGEIADL